MSHPKFRSSTISPPLFIHPLNLLVWSAASLEWRKADTYTCNNDQEQPIFSFSWTWPIKSNDNKFMFFFLAALETFVRRNFCSFFCRFRLWTNNRPHIVSTTYYSPFRNYNPISSIVILGKICCWYWYYYYWYVILAHAPFIDSTQPANSRQLK